MTLTGLENDYYLAENKIWLKLSDFSGPVKNIAMTLENLTTPKSLGPFNMSPINGEAIFSIKEIIKSVFPEVNHLLNNSMQKIGLTFEVEYDDTSSETLEISKNFIMGHRNRDGMLAWHLNQWDNLVVGKWLEFADIVLPSFPKRIYGDTLTDVILSGESISKIKLKSCDYKLLKFRNTLGGYQYFAFDYYENKTDADKAKVINKVTFELNSDNFKNNEFKYERELILKTSTKSENQPVFEDLIKSKEIYLYENGIFELLIPNGNKSQYISKDNAFENTASFKYNAYK